MQCHVGLAAVGGDDEAGDPAGLQDFAHPSVSESGFTHPKMFEREAQLLRLCFGSGKKFRVRRDPFPAQSGAPIGEVSQRGGVPTGHDLTAISHQRLQHWVGLITQFFGDLLDASAGGFGQSQVVAQRQ